LWRLQQDGFLDAAANPLETGGRKARPYDTEIVVGSCDVYDRMAFSTPRRIH